VCGKPAFAYRREADDSRIYLCIAHLPIGEAPHFDEAEAAEGALAGAKPDQSPKE
jgi:hypothetical protein